MENKLEDIKGIGKTTLARLEKAGIDSIGKLAQKNVEDLIKIQGIGKSTAERYIKLAQDFMNKLKGLHQIDATKKIIPKKNIFPNIQLKPPKIPPLKIQPLRTNSNPNNTASIKNNDKPQFLKNNQESSIKKQLTQQSKKINNTAHNKKEQTNTNPLGSKIQKKKSKKQKKKVHTQNVGMAPSIKTFFPQEVLFRIRFLHHKIKELEQQVEKENKNIELEWINYILEYIKILNINYKTQSQVKLIKELELTPTFYDPIENRDIEIWDIMFECARILWVLAKIYAFLSREYEANRRYKEAVIAMFESSRIFKASAHFSSACTRQEDIGTTLSFDNLELKSEEARIIAQSIVAEREEQGGNYHLASMLYSGLSALSKRLYYAKEHPPVKESLLNAQINYDLGKAYYLKSKASSLSTVTLDFDDTIKKFKQKSNHFFSKAEEIWQHARDNYKLLSLEELKNIDYNLSIVNDYIIENDEEIMDKDLTKQIPDIEPFIIVPENISPILPKSVAFLTKYPPKHLEFKQYKQFKDLTLEKNYLQNEKQKLSFKKATIKRTIKHLRSLYKSNDLGINKFSELMEKYLEKLEVINHSIRKLESKEAEMNKKGNSNKKVEAEINI